MVKPLKKHLQEMIMGNYNKEILELDIQKENIAENARKHTIEYHNGLIKLLEAKVNGNTEGILKRLMNKLK